MAIDRRVESMDSLSSEFILFSIGKRENNGTVPDGEHSTLQREWRPFRAIRWPALLSATVYVYTGWFQTTTN